MVTGRNGKVAGQDGPQEPTVYPCRFGIEGDVHIRGVVVFQKKTEGVVVQVNHYLTDSQVDQYVLR
jgi:hypothetical protein